MLLKGEVGNYYFYWGVGFKFVMFGGYCQNNWESIFG